MNFSRLVLLLAFLVSFSSSSLANSETRKEVIESVRKFGVTFAKGAIEFSDHKVEFKPTGNADANNAVRKVLEQYKQQKSTLNGGIAMGQAATELAIDGLTLAGTATGVGAVPAAVFKGSATLASDLLFESLQADVDKVLTDLLARRRDDLMKAGGGSYEQLRGQSPDQLKNSLRKSTDIFRDMKAQFPADDDRLVEAFEELTVDVIKNTNLATLDAAAKNASDISTIQTDLGSLARGVKEFRDQTITIFEEHDLAISALEGAVGRLGESVENINSTLEVQTRNQSFVNGFILNQMPPRLKAATLEQGFMSERFICDDGSNSCDAAKLKLDLIERFEAEADIQEFAGSVAATAKGISDVAKIAENVGIEIKGLNEIVSAANTASTAISAFASGNYLGAVVAITGAFGKRTDPDAERFKILMGYLKQEFAKINQKLDEIVENQKRISKQIELLSENVQKYYIATDERLVNIESKLDLALDRLREASWAGFLECNAAIGRIRDVERQTGEILLSDNGFVSFEAVFKGIDASGAFVRNCFVHAESKLRSLNNLSTFGNFLNVEAAINFTPEEEQLSNLQKQKYIGKSALKAFVENAYQPRVREVLSRAILDNKNIPQLYQLLASPQRTFDEFNKLYSALGADYDCSNGSLLTPSIYRLLCSSANPSANAELLLRKPMFVRGALEISEFLYLISAMTDFIDANNDFVSIENVYRFASDTSQTPANGELLLAATLSMMDATIASYDARHGAATATVLAELISSSEADEDTKTRIHQLIASNSILEKNVAMVMLRKNFGIRDANGTIVSTKIRQNTYRDAVEFARKETPDQFVFLRGIFGDKLSFSSKDGEVYLVVNSHTQFGKIEVPMPEASAFQHGQIAYPTYANLLIAQRAKLIERILDYEAIDGLTDEEATAFLGRIN